MVPSVPRFALSRRSAVRPTLRLLRPRRAQDGRSRFTLRCPIGIGLPSGSRCPFPHLRVHGLPFGTSCTFGAGLGTVPSVSIAPDATVQAIISIAHIRQMSIGSAKDFLAPGLERILISAPRIRRRVGELGRQITADYEGRDLCLVTVLKGGVFFLVDLARSIKIPVSVEFLGITTYGPQARSGAVRLTKDLDEGISGRHVLIVEDIVDTGLTLSYIYRNLQQRAPANLAICVLLDRPQRRIADLPIAYRGFEIPDVFVVGYGLDWRQKYRNLPFIAALEPSAYEGQAP